ncbi:MAG TPA: ATP-binding protein [Ktedonobacteraceae bacterium]|nr:ATP-binding protein [Ktedonobacteraceae bacterium]
MDFAAGNGSDTGHAGWQRSPEDFWAEESSLPATTISTDEPAAKPLNFAREYRVLAGVASNMRSGFILLNSAEQVAYLNPSAERLLGVAGGELLEQPIFDVRKQLVSLAANPESAQAELDRIWLHPEKESSTDLALADAAVRWLRVQSFLVRDDPGHVLGRGVLLDDITVERSSMQSRSETLARAAHELKTPLAIIKGCATTLLGNSLNWGPTMLHEMLQMIDTQADRLHDILNTLLDVWRLDAGVQNLRLSEVHIAKLLEQLVERWRKNAPHHQFVCIIPAVDIVVQCDALRIEQALNHLLNNAVTYSPPGSSSKIQLETNDGEVRLSITDQGVGIAHEHLERIFDRFYRISPSDERSSGSGLGLAVVRATVEAHGGKIWADSPGVGHGTTFYCTLPLAPSPQVEPLQQKPWITASASSPSGPLAVPRTGPLKQTMRSKVVVVENDARIARYLRAHLEDQQYRVQTVTHGIQFLRQIDLEEPDVILLAARLADMSGRELLQRLREFSRTPVMMLCDECDEDERVQLLDLGADDVIVKPFSMKELLARARVLLRRSLTPGEQPGVEAIFRTGELTIDYAQHQVCMQGHPVQLSRAEYKLLYTLAQNVGRVMTHELLLERVWGAEYNREVDFIWVYISRLRRKIEADPRHPCYILTVPDVGYKLAKL